MKDAVLIVAGDSHTGVWTAVGEQAEPLPGVVSHNVWEGGALAWSLATENGASQVRERTLQIVREAADGDFQGWILLSFGEVDLRCHILKHAAQIGLHQAVKRCVDRYLRFIDEAKAVYGRLGIWAPIASGSSGPAFNADYPTQGTEIDRNFATMLFTGLLRKGLEGKGVPVLSVLDLMILDNGKTDGGYLRDGCHLSQAIVPYLVELADKHLGLSLRPGFPESDITRLAEVRHVENAGRRWVFFSFEAVIPLASYRIGGPVLYDAEGPLLALTSNDQQSFTPVGTPQAASIGAGQIGSFDIGASARHLLVAAPRLGPMPDKMAIRGHIGFPSSRGSRDAMRAIAKNLG